MARHFLGFSDWSGAELAAILDLADELKRARRAGEPRRHLEGRTLAMLFEKSSTRTRVSFEAGMTELGGHAIMLSPRDTQIGRGEPIRDTARVLSRYVDAIMVRTYGQDVVEELARWSSVPVVNGLTDLLHPCQLMADLMTARERLGNLNNLKVAWIGDGNNMARSWIEAQAAFGFELTLACPRDYRVDEGFIASRRRGGPRVEVVESPLEAAAGANVVTTDVWASMGQEEEVGKRQRDFAAFTVDGRVMGAARPGAIFLHCLPAYRGKEVSEEVLEGAQSAVWDEAENRLHVQKAILVTLLKA